MALTEAEELELLELEEQETQAPAYEGTWLENAGQAIQGVMGPASQRLNEVAPYAASVVTPGLGLAVHAGQKMQEGAGALANMAGEMTSEGTGYLSSKLTPNQTSGVQKMGDYGAALAGTVVSALPFMAKTPGVNYSTKLGPAQGKPGVFARIKQMRTGVEASEFERLRRDPTAFFSTTKRAEVGQAVGSAKEAAGISTGVTDDIASLTPENISKARNIQGVANKAQDQIVAKLEEATKGKDLPVIEPRSKTGEPHALYAYSDKFGPGGKERAIYDVFGDPENPVIKKRGWGSSVPKEDLDELGIPVVGKRPNAQGVPPASPLSTQDIIKNAGITPDEVSTALEGINKRLKRLERTEGSGSTSFQQWSAIKNQFQTMLETVAPDVREANQAFSRVALRDKFMEPFPVNQSGTMSKIDSFGFTPGAVVAGGAVAGPIGAAAAYLGKTAFRSPFVAGLGTASRGLVDKLVDPALTSTVRGLSRKGLLMSYVMKRSENQQ